MMLRAAPLVSLVAYVAAQNTGLSISTPVTVVQCQPAQISFTATNLPVFISIIPGGQTSAPPLVDLGQQTTSPLTWVANMSGGTEITLRIRDSTGALAYSASITIQSSADASCIGAQASTTAAGTSAPATSAAFSTVSPASTTTSSAIVSVPLEPTTTLIISATGAVSGPDPIPSDSAPSNAATPNAKVGLVGLLGLAAAVVVV